MLTNKQLYEKILGSLVGCALGDAMGAVTENLTFHQIREKYQGGVRDLLKPDQSAFAYGNEAGEVTDDFSQTYLLTQQILAHKGICQEAVEDMLIAWSHMPRYFNRFAGPTTRFAIAQLQAKKEGKTLDEKKVIDYASQATNGSAMKISPAGFFHPRDVDRAILDACKIAQVTHNNQLAISGACAVAAAISAAFEENASVYDVVEAGLYGAKKGEALGMQCGHIVGGASVVERIHLAISIALSNRKQEEKIQTLYDIVGSGLHISEAVPSAFGLLLIAKGDPWESVCAAVNIGYDTDTIAAIVGSMAGALYGTRNIPSQFLQIIEEKNNMKIQTLAQEVCDFLL